MGDRANYLILNKGKLSVFYAHWGGPTVPRELNDGPAACERFIRSQQRVRSKALLEFAFMEGGIALDKDTRRALVFGGPGAVNYDPLVQARLMHRLRPIWEAEGWTIDWARRYAYDLVAFVGLPGEKVEEEAYVRQSAPWEDVVKPAEWLGTLLARKVDGAWQLRGSALNAGLLVHHGERLLEGFEELGAVEGDKLDPSDIGQMTALVFDELERRLLVVAPLFGGLNAPHYLTAKAREAFPGWNVELDIDDLLPAVRLRARGIEVGTPTPEEPKEPASEAELDELIDRVLAYNPEAAIEALVQSADEIVAGVVAEAEAKGETVTVLQNPHVRPKKRQRQKAAAGAKKTKPPRRG